MYTVGTVSNREFRSPHIIPDRYSSSKSMPRRSMLPYPSTSRRLCNAYRFPKATTIALITILFTCIYHSRRFLISTDQETLSHVEPLQRANDIDRRHIALEPAVEVVKEVTHDRDLSTESLNDPVANRLPLHPPNYGDPVVEATSRDETLENNPVREDLVGSISEENSLTTVEKDEQQTEETIGEVPATEKQEDADAAPVRIEQTDSTTTVALAIEGVPTAQKQEDEEISSDGEVIAVDKQETEDSATLSRVDNDNPVEGEGVSPDLTTLEKEATETEGELVQSAENQETEREAVAEDTRENVERAEGDIEIKGFESGQEVEETEKAVELSAESEIREAAEAPVEEEIVDSEKQELANDEQVTDSEIEGTEKQVEVMEGEATTEEIGTAEREDMVAGDEVSSEETEFSQSDKESTGEGGVLDIDVADKLEEKPENVDRSIEVEKDNSDLTTLAKQEISESEAKLDIDEREAVISTEQDAVQEVSSSEKQEAEEEQVQEEAQGDYNLLREDKQQLEPDTTTPEGLGEGVAETETVERR